MYGRTQKGNNPHKLNVAYPKKEIFTSTSMLLKMVVLSLKLGRSAKIQKSSTPSFDIPPSLPVSHMISHIKWKKKKEQNEKKKKMIRLPSIIIMHRLQEKKIK